MRVPSHPSALLGLLGVLVAPLPAAAQAAATTPLFHDAHFHLTNYIQEGTDIRAYLEIMGRGGQVRGVLPRGGSMRGRDDQRPSGPVPLRQRRGGPDVRRGPDEGVRAVRAWERA